MQRYSNILKFAGLRTYFLQLSFAWCLLQQCPIKVKDWNAYLRPNWELHLKRINKSSSLFLLEGNVSEVVASHSIAQCVDKINTKIINRLLTPVVDNIIYLFLLPYFPSSHHGISSTALMGSKAEIRFWSYTKSFATSSYHSNFNCLGLKRNGYQTTSVNESLFSVVDGILYNLHSTEADRLYSFLCREMRNISTVSKNWYR